MSEDREEYIVQNKGFEGEAEASNAPSQGMTINNMNKVTKPIVSNKEPEKDAHIGVIYEAEAEQILGITNKLIKDGERDTERKINRVESIRSLRMAYATITKIK